MLGEARDDAPPRVVVTSAPMTAPDDVLYQRPVAPAGQRVAAALGVTVFALGVAVMAWQVMGGALPALLAVVLMVGVYALQARLRPDTVLSPRCVRADRDARQLVLEGRRTARVAFDDVAAVSYGKHSLSDGIVLDAVTLRGRDGSSTVLTVHHAAAAEGAARAIAATLGLDAPTAPDEPVPGTDNDDDGRPDPPREGAPG